MDARRRVLNHAPPRPSSPMRRVASAPPAKTRFRSPSAIESTPSSSSARVGRQHRSPTGRGSGTPAEKAPSLGRSRSSSPPVTGHGSGARRARSSSPPQTGGHSAVGKSEVGKSGGDVVKGGFRQTNVRVAVRCRPLTTDEKAVGELPTMSTTGRTVTLSKGPADTEPHVFAFDHAFGPDADQLSVFTACGAPLVEQVTTLCLTLQPQIMMLQRANPNCRPPPIHTHQQPSSRVPAPLQPIHTNSHPPCPPPTNTH